MASSLKSVVFSESTFLVVPPVDAGREPDAGAGGPRGSRPRGRGAPRGRSGRRSNRPGARRAAGEVAPGDVELSVLAERLKAAPPARRRLLLEALGPAARSALQAAMAQPPAPGPGRARQQKEIAPGERGGEGPGRGFMLALGGAEKVEFLGIDGCKLIKPAFLVADSAEEPRADRQFTGNGPCAGFRKVKYQLCAARRPMDSALRLLLRSHGLSEEDLRTLQAADGSPDTVAALAAAAASEEQARLLAGGLGLHGRAAAARLAASWRQAACGGTGAAQSTASAGGASAEVVKRLSAKPLWRRPGSPARRFRLPGRHVPA
ncbi:unnamed protein product, partial [Prorocentrum cordatum]